jgi:hypothetical protein
MDEDGGIQYDDDDSEGSEPFVVGGEHLTFTAHKRKHIGACCVCCLVTVNRLLLAGQCTRGWLAGPLLWLLLCWGKPRSCVILAGCLPAAVNAHSSSST